MNRFQPQDKHLEKSIQFVIIGKVRRVVREVEGAALEMRFASNRRNVGSNPMLSACIGKGAVK